MFLHNTSTDFLAGQYYVASTEKQYKYRLLALSRFEDDVQIPVYEFSKDQMVDAFRSVSSSPAIAKSFKKLIETYFIWLSERGVDTSIGANSLANLNERELTQSHNKQFFYSAQHLLAKIHADTTFAAEIEDKEPEDYRMVVAIFLLSWLGLHIPEIMTFKKSYIHPLNNTITVNGERVPTDPRIVTLLEECAEAEGYFQINGYTKSIYRYRETQFLLRTAERRNMNAATIQGRVSVFNMKLRQGSEPYKLGRIFWSGVYARTYLLEMKEGIFPEIESAEDRMEFYSRIFKEQYSSINSIDARLAEYKVYKSVINNMGM